MAVIAEYMVYWQPSGQSGLKHAGNQTQICNGTLGGRGSCGSCVAKSLFFSRCVFYRWRITVNNISQSHNAG
jgi:hypothetical protein